MKLLKRWNGAAHARRMYAEVMANELVDVAKMVQAGKRVGLVKSCDGLKLFELR